MFCVCGHAAHPEGPCQAGIWELSDGSHLWPCSCEVFIFAPIEFDQEEEP